MVDLRFQLRLPMSTDLGATDAVSLQELARPLEEWECPG